ncbi:glycosyltransferase family 2 protein [Aerococcaceae bacterium INB8]|uniref:Glycosyltransferase family 2 protein n=2 Tax=Ruoffia halotolerans TaxID=2748684 RepID=A0A839A6M4_9LACT|nr:glycosyltransferase family 2 protein [Ruoffia halotolerans]
MMIVIINYAAMLLIAYFTLRKNTGIDRQVETLPYQITKVMKPISIVVPAYNESAGILNSIYSLLNLNYTQTEIIIVNDGSTDDTQEKVLKEFKLIPVFEAIRVQIPSKKIKQVYQSTVHTNLFFIEKENGGKSDALNAGINLAHYPYICSIDGDSILHRDALFSIMTPISASNGQIIAAGGTIRVANEMNVELGDFKEPKIYSKPLILIQVIEYVRSFLIGRISLSQFNLLLIISGAFSIFERQWVIDVGGYSTDMIGEDMELVVKLHRLIKERGVDKKIISIPDPICYTEAPNKLAILRRQRRRWHQGLLSSLLRHKDMLLNPKYGAIGMISLPYYWFVEAMGPVIEFLGVFYVILTFFFGQVYFEFIIMLSAFFLIYGGIYTIGALLLDSYTINGYVSTRALFRMVIISMTEVFWYRPLNIFWRLEGIYQTLKGNTEWGEMERSGFSRKGDAE